jgi:hypothetical protein
MEYVSVIGVYALMVLVTGWPMLLVASVLLVAYLRGICEPPRSTVLYAIGLAWPFTILVALVISRWWPESLGGPMLALYVHGPTLLATVVVFPLAAWWAKITMQPNRSLNPDAQKPRAG